MKPRQYKEVDRALKIMERLETELATEVALMLKQLDQQVEARTLSPTKARQLASRFMLSVLDLGGVRSAINGLNNL